MTKSKQLRVCIVAGARPNFIKVAPLIRAIMNNDKATYQLVYTGREDDPTLEGTLFDDLQIPRPDVYLGVDCQSLNELTGQVMGAFEHYLQEHPTDVVIVVDDLASTMAAAIVTKKQGIRLAHLVAGTRSFDITMPKEINRLVIDGLSDLLFTAGIASVSNTNREGAEQSRVYMVGNILIDNLRFNHNRWHRPAVMDELGLQEGQYVVFTINRKALLADKEKLQSMIDVVRGARCEVRETKIPIVAVLRDEAKRVISLLAPQSPLPEQSEIRIIIHKDLNVFIPIVQLLSQCRIADGFIDLFTVGSEFLPHGCRTCHQGFDITSSRRDRKQSYGSQHGIPASDLVRNHKFFISGLIGQRLKRTPCFICRCVNTSGCPFFAVSVFQHFPEDTERNGCFHRCARFGNHIHREILIADHIDHILNVRRRHIVACKIDLNIVLLIRSPKLQIMHGSFQEIQSCSCAQIGTPDTTYDQYL